MGANSRIEWTDHTFNPWMGCSKVSPACDGCYAEALMDLRYGKVQWGPHGERVRTAPANWKQPVKWNKEAAAAGTRPRVFCASLADVFDNQVPPEWRADLFALIRATPNLIWLLLTKRPQNIVKMVAAIDGGLPPNAALGTSVEDQVRFDLNVPALRKAKQLTSPAFAFLSCEPLLGPLVGMLHDIDWVIAGGETDQGKHKARPSNPDWIRSLRDQSAAAGAAFHFKQWGEYAPNWFMDDDGQKIEGSEWIDRMGKKAAGRLLDGVEHNGFPAIAPT
jgi:protein gp37